MTHAPSRTLAVILHADVVGSTRLVQSNEAVAHERVQDAFRRFAAVIARYHGITHELRGDALVAEFTRVSDAVSAALVFQRTNSDANACIQDAIRPEVRIGISLGEVVIADGTITGAGVVLAQRVEQLAEPGGICVHRAAYDTIPRHLPLAFTDMGEQQLKGFEEPVSVYSVTLADGAGLPGVEPLAGRRPRKRARAWLGAGAGVIFAGLFALWSLWSPVPAPDGTHGTALARPSIAVMPLENRSTDADQEYFSDGVTDSIINDLAKFSNLTVIARNTVFAYKNVPTPVQAIGKALDVEYLLEGSVQRGNDRVRIHVQLVDTTSLRQLWSSRYDESIGDLFEVQDKIARRIVQALSVRISKLEERRAFASREATFAAYDVVLRARALLRELRRAENFEARKLFRRALELDDRYCPGYAGLGWTHFNALLYGWSGAYQRELESAERLAREAIAVDEECVDGHRLLAGVYLQRRQHHLAILELERAIAINPNDADSHAEQGITFVYAGRIAAAIRSLTLALRIDPNRSADALMHLGMAFYLQRRYAEALSWLERAEARNPENVFISITLAATLAQLERDDAAKRAVEKIMRLDPFFRSEQFGNLFHEASARAHLLDGLRKAGMP